METSNKFSYGALLFLLVLTMLLSVITMSVCFSIKGAIPAESGGGDVPAVAKVDGTTSSTESTTTAKSSLYILCEEEGAIVVKSGGETLRTLGTPAAFLPEADRALLAAGIEIESDEQLAAAIQDYEN